MRTFITVVLMLLGLVFLGVGIFCAVSPDGALSIIELWWRGGPAWSSNWAEEYPNAISAAKAGGIAAAVIGGVLTSIGVIRILPRKAELGGKTDEQH